MSAERPFLKKSFAEVVQDSLADLRSGRDNRVILDDATEGSVLRTLVEAFGRELAVAYEQLERVYEAGYLDTATGASLDKVVELLGVERLQAGWIEGEVVFSRGTAAPFDVEIPAGTLVSGKDVPVFETLVAATLAAGTRELRVPVRSLEPEGVVVEAEKITVLNRPIAGIDTVSNSLSLQPRRDPESDVELRERSRGAVKGGRTATHSAIERAVRELGIVSVEIIEDTQRPGIVDVVLADEDIAEALFEEARRRVEEVRPAGIRVHVFQATPVYVRVRVRVRLEVDESPQARGVITTELREILDDHFRSLRVGQTVRWNKIRNLLAGHPRVGDIELLDDAWALLPADEDGSPRLEEDGTAFVDDEQSTAAAQRLLGTIAVPDGVFVGIEERALLPEAGVQIELVAPEPPAWVDVELRYAAADLAAVDEAALVAGIAEELRDLLPAEAAAVTIELTFEQLRGEVEAATEAAGVELQSVRFLVLHSVDGRVETVDQDDPAATDRAELRISERAVVRDIRLEGTEAS
ncbi:MAG: baseplate J/gp47 family protein [Nannocystaceae bacterium]